MKILQKAGVALIEEKIVELSLRWFGHVRMRPVEVVVRRVDWMNGNPIFIGRRRPRKTLN